jgi:hypothetical protein
MGSGGARYGAGRPAYKVKTGGLKFIDVRQFAKMGYLKGEGAYSWHWYLRGEPAGSIHVHVNAREQSALLRDIANGASHNMSLISHLRLVYSATINAKSTQYNDRVDLAYTACNFGKVRPWFVCPHCYKRLAKLYLRFGYFACRHCQKVAYSSQSQDAIDRTWGVQYKIEARIGERHKRPKGMHHKTFEALREKLYQSMWVRETAIDARVAQVGAVLGLIDAQIAATKMSSSCDF